MSMMHLEAAYQVGGLGLTEKAVLICHAWHANHVTGTSWTKAETVAAEICSSVRLVHKAVAALRDRGLLHVHAYAQGGRGRATEYQVCVFPGGRYLPPERAEKHARGAGFTAPAESTGARNPARGALDSRTDSATRAAASDSAATQSAGAAAETSAGPTYIEPATDSAHARPRARERHADAPPAQRRNPATGPRQASSIGDALRRAVPGLRIRPVLDSMPMPAEAATPADSEEAQGTDHDPDP